MCFCHHNGHVSRAWQPRTRAEVVIVIGVLPSTTLFSNNKASRNTPKVFNSPPPHQVVTDPPPFDQFSRNDLIMSTVHRLVTLWQQVGSQRKHFKLFFAKPDSMKTTVASSVHFQCRTKDPPVHKKNETYYCGFEMGWKLKCCNPIHHPWISLVKIFVFFTFQGYKIVTSDQGAASTAHQTAKIGITGEKVSSHCSVRCVSRSFHLRNFWISPIVPLPSVTPSKCASGKMDKCTLTQRKGRAPPTITLTWQGGGSA